MQVTNIWRIFVTDYSAFASLKMKIITRSSMNINHYLISALFALLLLTGCATDPATATLDRAETLMDVHPDSALALLDTLPSPASAKENARYALLYSQALDKNYIDVADDSLILIAVNHYENSGDLHRLMLSYYYHARVLYNKKSFPRSLLVHHKSLKYAEQLGDDFWCGRNADGIYNLYENFYHGADALHYAQLAYKYLRNTGQQPFLNYAIYGYARANFNIENYKEAIEIATQTCDSASKYDDEELFFEAKRMVAEAHYYDGEPDKAIQEITEILSQKYNPDLLGLLGHIYIDKGYDALVNKINPDTTEKLTPNMISFKREKRKWEGDYKTALHFTEILMLQNDSVHVEALNQGFNAELSNYFDYENQIKEFEIRDMNRQHIILVIILCNVFAVAAIIAFLFYRRQKRTLNRNIAIACNLQEVLTLKESQFRDAQDSIKNLLASKYTEFDTLCTSYYESRASLSLKKRISDEVEKLVNSFSSNKRLSEFEKEIDKNYSGIISSLKSDLPNIKDADYRLFIYSVLGFSNTAITLFLNEEKIESIYNRKARLKTKIKKLESQNRDVYLSFLRINTHPQEVSC